MMMMMMTNSKKLYRGQPLSLPNPQTMNTASLTQLCCTPGDRSRFDPQGKRVVSSVILRVVGPCLLLHGALSIVRGAQTVKKHWTSIKRLDTGFCLE